MNNTIESIDTFCLNPEHDELLKDGKKYRILYELMDIGSVRRDDYTSRIVLTTDEISTDEIECILQNFDIKSISHEEGYIIFVMEYKSDKND